MEAANFLIRINSKIKGQSEGPGLAITHSRDAKSIPAVYKTGFFRSLNNFHDRTKLSFKPEVSDIDARLKPYTIVTLGIIDQPSQQLTHSGSPTDVHVASLSEFQRMLESLLLINIQGIF